MTLQQLAKLSLRDAEPSLAVPQRVVTVEPHHSDCHRVRSIIRSDPVPGRFAPLYQESKLASSGLVELFSGVEVLSVKTVASYRAVLARRGIDPKEFVMVGNSLRSDILPVVEMGARAIHIPYHVTWQHDQVDDAALPSEGWHRLRTIGELTSLLSAIELGGD
jgi:hypothetical protein